MHDNDTVTKEVENTTEMDIDGTLYIIKELFADKDTVNDIIARRIKADGCPLSASGEKSEKP